MSVQQTPAKSRDQSADIQHVIAEIPIIDENLRVVGWAKEALSPRRNGTIENEGASKLLSGELTCTFIRIDDPALAERAGAPPGWQDEWRCLAICNVETAGKLHYGSGLDGRGGTWRLHRTVRGRRTAAK